MKEKPILFNTDMVCAILDGRKTQTRRVIKPHNPVRAKMDGYKQGRGLWFSETRDNTADKRYIKDYSVSPCWISDRNYIKLYSPYKPGDVLWVRETWTEMPYGYVYRADEEEPEGWDPDDRWHPSIHMPRKAARIFLRVKDVRAERLQDISEDDVCCEGAEEIILSCQHMDWGETPPEPCFNTRSCADCIINYSYPELFGKMVWNPTIQPKDLPLYGWDANPWVWVISFDRMDGDADAQPPETM